MWRPLSTFEALAISLALVAGLFPLGRPKNYLDKQRPLPEVPPSNGSSSEVTPLGRKVDDFALLDYQGRRHSLSELVDQKLVVLVFLGTDCPLAKLYGPRLAELEEEFKPRGVAFLGINSNAHDSPAQMACYARTQGIGFPLLQDADQAVADRLGAQRTPEAFVLDEKRVVRYWGRIDDQYGIGTRRGAPVRRDLADALNELLEDKPVSQPLTPSVGCRIGRPPRTEPQGQVNYSKHVSRILEKRCVECHRQGEVGPFALTDYRQVVGRAAMIREVIQAGRMPPWFADPDHGRFRNDARLTPEEKDLILQWIASGCPEGDPSDLPEFPRFLKGWRIPQPDQIVYMSEQPYTVPAEGTIDYQHFLVDPGFREDKYLRAVEVRPGNQAVVHHALVVVVRPGEERTGLGNSGALIDYVPGMSPTMLPEDMAIHVPAGSKFLFQLHYTPNGSVQTDRSYLGMVFADPKKVKQYVIGGEVANHAIEIPAGAGNHRQTAEHVIGSDMVLLSMAPHMHLRGRSFRYEAVYPDGAREILLDVPRYDFNWQLRYELAEPKRLPKGTRLICTAHYDNSANNAANPDPTKAVRWGDQTWDEMLLGFFAVAQPKEE